jgi:hypothetical protein
LRRAKVSLLKHFSITASSSLMKPS